MILAALACYFFYTPEEHPVHRPVAQNNNPADPLQLSGILDSGHYIDIIMPRSATEEEILTMLKERCEAGGVTNYGDILGLTARLVAMKNGYNRTRYWFERGGAKVTFSIFLGSLANVAHDYAVSVLEIGSFEGGSALWFAQHLLKHPQSRMICLDSWEGSPEFADVDMSAVEDRFKWNMAQTDRAQRIQAIKGDSMLSLSTLIAAGQSSSFDVIYVDASHRMADTLADCLLAFRLLKVGGTMIVDDEIRFAEVAEATDALERALGNELEILQRKEQLVAKKVAGRFASQGLVALRELGDVAVEKVTLPE
ncbi:unnamed protein product [Ascophyllum nodosum]